MNLTYDPSLVALSLAVAIIAVYVSIDLASRIQKAPPEQRRDWLIAGAIVLGMGIWTMHFVGMIALHSPVHLGYELTTTLFSMLPAIIAAGIALHLIQRPILTHKHRLLGGLAMGSGIGAMHYSGMSAMVMSPPLRYEPGMFAFSVVFAVAGSALAIHLAHGSFYAAPASRQARKIVSAVVGGTSIAGMHYLGMAATIITPGSICISGYQGDSLPHQYNPWLLAMSVTIAVMASFTALDIAGRLHAAIGRVRYFWLLGGGFAMGIGIWSMHFVGMIAMHTDQAVTYEIKMTLLSILPALVASGFALYMIARGEMTPRMLGLSGVLMASGIGAMHYIGMAAVQIDPPFRYDPTFFVLSILVAIAASVSALWIGFQQHSGNSLGESITRKIGSALLMGLAIAGMHYTGMSATHVIPASGSDMAALTGLDPQYIAVFVGIATFIMLLIAYMVAFYDARIAAIRGELAKHLSIANEQLQTRATALATEMTAEIRAGEQALRTEKQRAQTTLAAIADAVIVVDADAKIRYLNLAAERLLAVTAAAVSGKRFDSVVSVKSDGDSSEGEHPVTLCLREGRRTIFPSTAMLAVTKSADIAIAGTVAPFINEIENRHTSDATTVPTGAVIVLADVSERRRMEDTLRWQAHHDQLTLLPNRRAFEEKLAAATHSARNTNSQYALLMLDLDQFKLVNDVAGHAAGDQMLCAVAAILQQHTRDNDMVARLGGDEFCVLLPNCPQPDATRIAENLREEIAHYRLHVGDHRFQCTASVGQVAIIDGSQSAAQLMMAVDSACYLAKEGGRNRIWTERLAIAETAQRRSEIAQVTQLDRAIEQGRLKLYCQPILALSAAEGAAQHIEVLLRMIDDDGALIPPMAFIPAAERYGVMPRIDRWVIEAALKSCSQIYRDTPDAPAMVLAINISATSLSDDSTIDFIAGCLARHPLPARVTPCLEITETAAITNLMQARRFVAEARKLGCRLSLDDFGSGMSSFAYLKSLQVDYLKIDGSFVKDMNTDEISHGIVEAIFKLGRMMSLQVVAEHVKDAETADKLGAMGVHFGQGFHLAMPQPLEDFWAQSAGGKT